MHEKQFYSLYFSLHSIIIVKIVSVRADLSNDMYVNWTQFLYKVILIKNITPITIFINSKIQHPTLRKLYIYICNEKIFVISVDNVELIIVPFNRIVKWYKIMIRCCVSWGEWFFGIHRIFSQTGRKGENNAPLCDRTWPSEIVIYFPSE